MLVKYVTSMMMSMHAQLQPVIFDDKALQGRICPLPTLPMTPDIYRFT